MQAVQFLKWLLAAELAEAAAVPGIVLLVVGAVCARRGWRRTGWTVGVVGAVLTGTGLAALGLAWGWPW